MRADRLIAALMLLQTRQKITAAELAQELEISTRTARRDLEALAMSGVPIYSQPGRGGGWRLIGGARTDLTGLSSDEARALFLALSHQQERNPALEAALRKLVVAVPERFRQEAIAASSAVRVDETGWGQIGSASRSVFVDELSHAVIAGKQASIRYATRGQKARDRVVHPLGLVTKRGVWYLVANTSEGLRTFRLSRVRAVTLRDQDVERPDDFDLDQAWASIVTTVEARRVGIAVTALVDNEVMYPFQYVFSNRHEVVARHDDRRTEVRINEATPAALAAQVAGFGSSVELVEPPDELVAELRRITKELHAQWSGA